MKSSQRFDYRRLADGLVERGLLDYETAEHILGQCTSTGALLPEILVQEDLVSDWEVSRVVCELYHLPFLTVDNYPPPAHALEGLDPDFLRRYALVPADRFGKLLTVIMPGLVPTEVLEHTQLMAGAHVLPVVGSVTSNRRWLNEHTPASEMPQVDAVGAALPNDDDWASIFDAGEEAVQLDLRTPEDDADSEGMQLELRETSGGKELDIGDPLAGLELELGDSGADAQGS